MININISYPKVLILGETFRYNGGGGITLINLFKDWNSDNLAVITERIEETSSETNCKKFYRLGHLEIKFPFPFNYINKIGDSGEVKLIKLQNASIIRGNAKRKVISRLKFEIEKTYYGILIFLGLCISNYRIVISEQLIKWIKDFSPDIIYAQSFRYNDMVFARKIKEATGIPLALHVMDDSVSFSIKPNVLYFYWKNKINNTFEALVKLADIPLSISKEMSDEYFRRYNKQFIPFRNPIDISTWTPFIKKDWSLNGEIKIIYTGRLAVPNMNALYTFCRVIDKISKSGFPVRFHIYSIDTNVKFASKINKFKSVVIHEPVAFNKIPSLFSIYDIALLPIDFTAKGIEYAKYSISTKTSEYMISGVPILLFAPKQVALTAYAEKNRTMQIVCENGMEKLTFALKELILNEKLRSSLALKAIAVAKSESDAIRVRNCFREVLLSDKTDCFNHFI